MLFNNFSTILFVLLYQIILFSNMLINSEAKCIIIGSTVKCHGSKWRQDLLPIENHSIKKLQITNCTDRSQSASSDALPMDIEFIKLFANLEALSIQFCELTTLPVLNFASQTLVSIDLSHNSIRVEPTVVVKQSYLSKSSQSANHNASQDDDNQEHDSVKPGLSVNVAGASTSAPMLFVNSRVLEHINLSYNRLTQLPIHWFNCINNRIRSLILEDNLIQGLDPRLEECFSVLELVSLRSNLYRGKLRKVALDQAVSPGRSKSVVRHAKYPGAMLLGNTEELTAEGPRDSTLPGSEELPSHNHGVLPQWRRLRLLDLSHNQVGLLHQLPLLNMPGLQRLILSHNNLASRHHLPSSSACDVGTAAFFIAALSALYQADDTSPSHIGLQHLDLSHNHALQTIAKCWTFGLTQLTTLNLVNCSINSIEAGALESMKSLHTIDLSHNQLRQLPSELAVASIGLRWLSLHDNKLSQSSSSDLVHLRQLEYLDLSNNQYSTLLTVQSDIINHNAINMKPPNQVNQWMGLLTSLNQLRVLNISGNRLTNINLTRELPEYVEQVQLLHNRQLSSIIVTGPSPYVIRVSRDVPLLCDCQLLPFLMHSCGNSSGTSSDCRCHQPTTFIDLALSDVIGHLSKQCRSSQRSQSDRVLDSKTNRTGERPLKDVCLLNIYVRGNVTQHNSALGSDTDDTNSWTTQPDNAPLGNVHWTLKSQPIEMRCEFYSSFDQLVVPTITWWFEPMVITDQILRRGAASHKPLTKYSNRRKVTNGRGRGRSSIITIGPISAKLSLNNVYSRDTLDTVQLNPLPTQSGSNSNYGYIKGQPYKYVSFLRITHGNRFDAGRYFCTVGEVGSSVALEDSFPFSGNSGGGNGRSMRRSGSSMAAPLVSESINFDVYESPEFISRPAATLSIIEGEMAEIVCRARGYPPPVTSLGRSSSTSPTNGTSSSNSIRSFPAATARRMVVYKDDDSAFYITNVKLEDSGLYLCTTKNPVASVTASFRLYVQVGASIAQQKSDSTHLRLVQGQPMILQYKIRGVPPPAVQWSKDDSGSQTPSHWILSLDQSCLIIPRVNQSDAGIYHLSVLNALGGQTASTTVEILPPSHGLSHQQRDNAGSAGIDAGANSSLVVSVIVAALLSCLLTSVLWLGVVMCCVSRCLVHKNMNKLSSSSTAAAAQIFYHPPSRSTSSYNCTPRNLPLSMTTSSLLAPHTPCPPPPSPPPPTVPSPCRHPPAPPSSTYTFDSGIDLMMMNTLHHPTQSNYKCLYLPHHNNQSNHHLHTSTPSLLHPLNSSHHS